MIGQHRRDVPLSATDLLKRVDVQVDWTPVGMATARLTVSLVGCTEGGCLGAPLATVSGPSPLRLEASEVDLPPASDLLLRVTPEDRIPSVAALYASPAPQPFHVGGNLTYHLRSR